MTYIRKETPTGVINGINKVFTFSSEIDQIDDLWIDGVIYTSYVISGKKITLSDAPEISIFGDYLPISKGKGSEKNIIYKEFPIGSINNENKSFVFKNEIEKLETVWVDGVVYSDFTFEGKKIVLGDAPEISVFADYIPKSVYIAQESNITFLDIKNEVWRLLGQKATSVNFSDKILTNKINTILAAVWKGEIINLTNPKEVLKAGNMSFQNGYNSFNIVEDSCLRGNLLVGDIDAILRLKGLQKAGYVIIGPDIVKYASKSDTKISGISGITCDYKSGEKVSPLYELPDDFQKIISVEKIVKGEYYEIPYRTGAAYFEILKDMYTGKNLLRIKGVEPGVQINISYVKKAPVLSGNDDFCPIPGTYGLSVIAVLTAGILSYESNFPMYSALLAEGYTNLKEMFQYFNEEIKRTKQKIYPKVYGFRGVK